MVVVGAGAAGCVAARRLADTGAEVTLVEAGPGRPFPPSLTTLDTFDALDHDERFWAGMVAEARGARPEVPYRQGRGLGGGSAVNAMAMTVGDRADYDRWEHRWGATGWGWPTLGPALAELSRAFPTPPARPGGLSRVVAARLAEAGMPVDGISAQVDQWGFVAASLAASLAPAPGRRRGPAQVFVPSTDPSARSPRLITGAGVERVVFRGDRAVGVELAGGVTIPAGRVVLAAGALNTPALLGRSGVGLAPVVPVLDHPSFVLTVELAPEVRASPRAPTPPVSGLIRWWSAAGFGSGSGSEAAPPDLLAFVLDHVGSGPEGRRYGAVVVILADVASVGSLGWEGGRTRFDPGWLAHPRDRHRMVAGVRQVVELLRPGPDRPGDGVEAVYLDDRGTPAAELARMGDDEVAAWLEAHPGPVVHPSSTCSPVVGAWAGPMDPVTELDGTVVGHPNLHLVDGSVLPYLPAANPQLPIMATALHLADRLAGKDV